MRGILMTLTLLLLLLLVARPVAPDDLAAALDPDAALIAEQWGGGPLTGLSWHTATVERHRCWVDLLQPTGHWGLGASADVAPGKAACAGGGYAEGWVVYFGAHVDF